MGKSRCFSSIKPVSRLQSEILRLEFSKKEPDAAGRISERQLAELLLAYADYSPKRRAATLKRVKRTFKVTASIHHIFHVFFFSTHLFSSSYSVLPRDG
jgi:hypothetical protein